MVLGAKNLFACDLHPHFSRRMIRLSFQYSKLLSF